MKNNITGKLLVFDMDGTLLDSKCNISNENRDALEYFVRNGGKLAIATGRMELSVMQYIDRLPVNMPSIFYNGAAVYDIQRKELLWKCCLDENIQELVRDLSEKFPEMGIEIFSQGQVYFVKTNEETDRHNDKEPFIPIYLPLENIPKPWYKILLAWPHEKLEKVEVFLKEHPGNYRTVYSEPQFLEILSPAANKGMALKEMIKISSCRQDRIIAVGDNMNDIEMIRFADSGVAVENAHTLLKAEANFCCCHHDRHVAQEIVKWIEEGIIGGFDDSDR